MDTDFSIDPGNIEPPFEDEQFQDVLGDSHEDPTMLAEGYEIHCAEEMNGAVPKFISIIEHPTDPEVYSREWIFEGVNGFMVLQVYQRHRYGDGTKPPQIPSQVKNCCFQMLRQHGLSAEHCPDEVRDLVARISDAPVVSLAEEDQPTAEE